jgi:hypothetical protein
MQYFIGALKTAAFFFLRFCLTGGAICRNQHRLPQQNDKSSRVWRAAIDANSNAEHQIISGR